MTVSQALVHTVPELHTVPQFDEMCIEMRTSLEARALCGNDHDALVQYQGMMNRWRDMEQSERGKVYSLTAFRWGSLAPKKIIQPLRGPSDGWRKWYNKQKALGFPALKPRSHTELMQVRQWRRAGLSYAEIGRRVGVSGRTVEQICWRAEQRMDKLKHKARFAKITYLYDLQQACIAVPTEAETHDR